ncbi:competence protein [Lederbergia citrea]|uniref:Competence protein n=1 Tax=Lederbergia citrea TaxID=2833581 RepID=A0A942Z3A1_9BACI|nr:competence protein [Lederbergia citrea]MBS4177415.1 competence protein [Lederbergia citrea]MBS4204093.1 competence protein [Lederbergia citrea]MBS4221322.1 competence protein [Lederbergia citrea]
MGKRSKSKRFIHQGKNSVQLHAERFPYRSTLEEAENKKIAFMEESSLGGIE